MTQTIGRIYTFDAAHQLPNLKPDSHPCRRMHGHSYTVHVIVEGPLVDGMVRGLQFEHIDIAMEPLLNFTIGASTVEHRLLNEVIDIPTVENISMWFAEKLRSVLNVPVTVRVFEGFRSWAEATVE